MTTHAYPELHQTIQALCAIASPTGSEKDICHYIENELKETLYTDLYHSDDGLIVSYITNPENPTVGLVGHTDVVPEFFDPLIKDGKLYGAGASDMKAGLGSLLYWLKKNHDNATKQKNIVFIAYNREEGTPLHENGLYGLIKTHKELLKTIDCAIVAEPTDNAIQLGCMGSMHVSVTITGQEAHSARPWTGDNALYKALPIIQKIQNHPVHEQHIEGVVFKDVMTITECSVPKGRTTIPGTCTLNINVRFSPNQSEDQAFDQVKTCLKTVCDPQTQVTLIDSAPAGAIHMTAFTKSLIKSLGLPIQAKQAWTDVAQLAQLGIGCFNYGPGHQTQAHQQNEYVSLALIDTYYNDLSRALS